MALIFHESCFSELLELLLTSDSETRVRVRGNLMLLEEFGPTIVALFEIGGLPSLHELRIDTNPPFGLICSINEFGAMGLAAYFEHNDIDRINAVDAARTRSDT